MTSAPGLVPGSTLKLHGIQVPRYVRPRFRDSNKEDLHPPNSPKLSESAVLGGSNVDLLAREDALDLIVRRASSLTGPPLAVASANLDHINHFGHGSRWAGSLGASEETEWLTLLDGAPLVAQAKKVTNCEWPRLAGSDLTWPLLEAAEAGGLRVGFLGGRPEAHKLVRDRLAKDFAGLEVAGYWAPERSVLSDVKASLKLAAEVASVNVDILFVCLGKPRQELWIKDFGHLTRSRVLLAFGAAVDFLAGTMRRAPGAVQDAGLEWAWRLVLEPRRLASRYLVDGPAAYLKLHRFSHAEAVLPATNTKAIPAGSRAQAQFLPASVMAGNPSSSFFPLDRHTEVAVLIVTYNSEANVPLLLADLRYETAEQSIKVVVADNSPGNATMDLLAAQPDVHAFRTGGNLGYAAGINLAKRRAGTADAYLVLNPDVRIERGSVNNMLKRMRKSSAGVVVPLLLEDDGSIYPSLRHEPSLSRALGDALFGSHIPDRPSWLSEMDFDPQSYAAPHPVDWATGAALLIRAGVAEAVGDWDERYFLYSEETDFLRRVRSSGATVWFEPDARMQHSRGASGSSPSLDALMATNRIRYVRKFRPAGYAWTFHAAVLLSALLRAPRGGSKGLLSALTNERRWEELPHTDTTFEASLMPEVSVVIPAHNEEAVLGRTLTPLAPYVAAGRIEAVVVCNACTDNTAGVARSFPGVHVVEIPEASKVAALNEADRIAKTWPRVYLDADIELHPAALSTLASALAGGARLAARPDFVYDSRHAHWLVQAYYRARYRMPSQHAHLWGAGIYAVSSEGHARISTFPQLTADDLFVDSLFDGTEKAVLHTAPVVVRTPRTITDLDAILRRTYRGNAQQAVPVSAASRLPELLRTIRGPVSVLDAAVYGIFALRGRVAGRKAGRAAWERDESSRCADS